MSAEDINSSWHDSCTTTAASSSFIFLMFRHGSFYHRMAITFAFVSRNTPRPFIYLLPLLSFFHVERGHCDEE